MSRGFVKEEDQEALPFVAPRAHLPEGSINYVTPNGMDGLKAEYDQLITERDHLNIADENERRIATNHINAKIQLLNARITSAKIVDLTTQPQHEVRFGALVTLKIGDQKKLQQYQIVGVDEADISKGKISFISPIAQLLTDKNVGDKVVLKLTNADRTFEIMAIEYPKSNG